MKRIILIICIIPLVVKAQESLLFKPLTANHYESRIGSIYQFNKENLRLDIGNSFELVKFELLKNDTRVGADFFTLSQLRIENNFKFPVETIDYYFGLNLSGNILNDSMLFYRVRAAHISAHLVDGLIVSGLFSPQPFVFSREFIEITLAKYFGSFRIYGGINFLYSTKPKTPEPVSIHFGFDDCIKVIDLLSLRYGYHLLLSGIEGSYKGSNSATAGLLLNIQNQSGIYLGLQYYSGRNLHGQFYLEDDNFIGIGLEFIY